MKNKLKTDSLRSLIMKQFKKQLKKLSLRFLSNFSGASPKQLRRVPRWRIGEHPSDMEDTLEY